VITSARANSNGFAIMTIDNIYIEPAANRFVSHLSAISLVSITEKLETKAEHILWGMTNQKKEFSLHFNIA